MPSTIWLLDRSRVVDGRGFCNRARLLGYHIGPNGYGIQRKATKLPLMTGIAGHDGLAPILEWCRQNDALIVQVFQSATLTSGEILLPVPNQIIRDAVKRAQEKYWKAVELRGFAYLSDQEEVKEVTREQLYLIEGLIWAWCLEVLPHILLRGRVIEVEVDDTYVFDCTCGLGDGVLSKADHEARDCNGMGLMCRPDFLLETRLTVEMEYHEFKTTGMDSPTFRDKWDVMIQMFAATLDAERRWEKHVQSIYVHGLIKGKRQGEYNPATKKYDGAIRQQSVFCLAPSTRVLTADMRWIPIGEVGEGDKLAAFDEHPVLRQRLPNRYWREATVSKIGKLLLPCVRLTFSDGTKVVCSKEHRWLTARVHTSTGAQTTQWRAAHELRPKDIYPTTASRVFKVCDPWEADTTFDAGWLSGILEGEGHLTHLSPKGNRDSGLALGVTQKPGDVLERAAYLLKQYGVTVYGPYGPPDGRSAGKLLVQKAKIDVLTILGTVRPKRLLQKLDLNRIGVLRSHHQPVVLQSVEDVGEQLVVPIETTTGTLIAEGLASHNCYGYKKPAMPPMEQEEWAAQYEYTDPYDGSNKRLPKAFRKAGVWELPDTLLPADDPGMSKAEFWAKWIPQEARGKSLVVLGPYSRQTQMVDHFLDECKGEEDRWQQGLWQLYDLSTQILHETYGPELPDQPVWWEVVWPDPRFQTLMDRLFPRSYECRRYGARMRCQFEQICLVHEGWETPLNAGQYIERVPHHQDELQQMLDRGLTPVDAALMDEQEQEL